MKIKLTKQQSIIIITITTLILVIGLYFIFRKPYKPIPIKTVNYDNYQTYEQKLEHWKQQCDFKPGVYTSYEIRNKLGRSDRKVYCLDNGDIINPEINGVNRIYAYNAPNYQLDYKYVSGYTSDDWYFTRYGATPSYFPRLSMNNIDIFLIGASVYDHHIKFNTYVDTTPPPQPPTH